MKQEQKLLNRWTLNLANDLGKAMARMETGTAIRPSDIQTVMEKFNIYPAGYGNI